MIAVSDLPELPDTVQALHFGAISLIPEPCGTAYETLMQRHAASSVISFDPNIRPGFITDADKHRKRINKMLAMSDIVKVSDEDLAWIAPERSMDAAIKGFLDGGVSIVLLTKGSQGVTAYTGSEQVDVEAQKVEVVDTIGAGDTFNAGLLSGLNKQAVLNKSALKHIKAEQLRTAVEFAVKVAAVTVSRAGANPPWLKELAS
jgi:fructokinase